MLRIAVLALILIGSPPVIAQSVGKVYRIAYLTPRPLPDAAAEVFFAGLRELGYVDGRNIAIELRSANQQYGELEALAAALVAQKVDVIVAATGITALAAKKATSRIPIVVASSNDAVTMGIVDSLQRPGGNVTGVTGLSAQLAPKRLEILKELVPGLKRVAVLWCSRGPISRVELAHVQAAAKMLSVQVDPVAYDERPEAWPEALSSAVRRQRPQALFMVDCTSLPYPVILDFARKERLPLIVPYGGLVESGALVSYGPDWGDLHRRVAPALVDKILKGAKPGDLPFEQPTKFELLLNRKTAKLLAMTIPQPFLLRVDRIVD